MVAERPPERLSLKLRAFLPTVQGVGHFAECLGSGPKHERLHAAGSLRGATRKPWNLPAVLARRIAKDALDPLNDIGPNLAAQPLAASDTDTLWTLCRDKEQSRVGQEVQADESFKEDPQSASRARFTFHVWQLDVAPSLG